jgi:hypothetical protein
MINEHEQWQNGKLNRSVPVASAGGGGYVQRENKITISILVIIGILGIAVYGYYFAYGRNSMVLDILQAKEYLWRARASINLVEMADYMGKAETALGDRTGNPNWLFHLPDTDFDLIKHDLEKNIEAALNISMTEDVGSYGYQRAVNNLEEVCVELNSHLDAAIDWSTNLLPTTILLNTVAWIIFAVVIVYLIASNRKSFVLKKTTITLSKK